MLDYRKSLARGIGAISDIIQPPGSTGSMEFADKNKALCQDLFTLH